MTDAYIRDGFHIHAAAVIPQDVLAAAQAAMVAVRDGSFATGQPPSSHPGYDPATLCKINDAHLADHDLHALICHPALGALAAQITGARAAQVWASQLLIKPPASAQRGNVGWHQDRQYWRYWQQPEGLFTMWIALSDVKAASGPMLFVPGSHRWGFLDAGDFFGKDHAAQRRQIPVPHGQTWAQVPALLAPGGVSFHHCLTYHGSGPNASGVARCSIAVHCRTEQVRPIAGNDNYYVSHLQDPALSPVLFGSDADFD
ncbi:MAG: phytanoyl-CoA dioxygenase family protein [bacterium]|nr:phytanoyl-CoA dioxygenase family protein [bacterium]